MPGQGLWTGNAVRSIAPFAACRSRGFEVLLMEAGDGDAFLVRDDYVDKDVAHVDLERRAGGLGVPVCAERKEPEQDGEDMAKRVKSRSAEGQHGAPQT